MALPTVAGTLGVSPPVYVRKLQRKTHWGASTDVLDDRVTTAVQKAFLEDKHTKYSFYLVQTDEDLRRVAIGLNANRDSLTEVLDLVAFAPDELTNAGVTLEQTPGDTKCLFANKLHYDGAATEDQLTALCRTAMESGRMAGRCTASTMSDVVREAQREQCDAALPAPAGCLAPGCG